MVQYLVYFESTTLWPRLSISAAKLLVVVGNKKKNTQPLVRQPLYSELVLLHWIFAKIGMLAHDPDTKDPKTGQNYPDTKRPKILIYPPKDSEGSSCTWHRVNRMFWEWNKLPNVQKFLAWLCFLLRLYETGPNNRWLWHAHTIICDTRNTKALWGMW